MANIKQIAQMAGVSIATVSRVLNEHPYVKEDKRAAVLDAVAKLNYSQNMNAVHLVRGKTLMIAVILPYVNHPYFASIIDGVANAALACNYKLLLCQTDYQAEEEYKVLELLKMKQIDGIIICSKTISWDVIEPYASYGPIIACENAGDREISSVFIDHYGSFKLGMDYLITKGHQHIGYFIGRGDSYNNINRKRAYAEALQAIGETPREEWGFDRVFTFERGVEVIRQILTMKERPTALIGAGDDPAAAIVAEARKHGIRVPEDLAVIGLDNQPIAEVMGITTIEQSMKEVGGLAFQAFYERINNKDLPPTKHELPFRLIERSTV
ncbi:LacI family transcriptional regulator [Paenibacillus selenitireducens]|uniref:LacI family transcriptional regulator n=1 Tax=Paenibacillus selenitireducens TaxID=1324314 RepID=A0A1T2XDI0_9BACL|nr:LacI family DNA-binding transcriptional regulator [Paenibacillus selenitireducens]OPA77736.1 LacI family transcriptional regulator [Paenibacillus selenitireducens]